MLDSLTIDGVGPMPVERPGTVAELCAIVRRCAESRTAIYPVGGGMMLDYGMPPARPGIALSTTALNRIIDYPARDLTITVEAGVTMEKLQEVLAAENQWLPIDIPLKSTIGGAIACDISGPRRYGYGTLRDYIIGITVVNDRGEECKAGGRVVKNVAGYDMMKLHTGALGTLGVITQVTLRVKPKPESSVCVAVFQSDRDDALIQGPMELFGRTKTQPVLTDFALNLGFNVQGHRRPEKQGATLFVGFEGTHESVEWQAKQFGDEVSSASLDFNRTDQELNAPWGRRDFRDSDNARATFRTTMPVSASADFCAQARTVELHFLDGPIAAGVLHGTIYGDKLSPRQIETVVRGLRDHLYGNGGNLVLGRCESDLKRSLGVWGRPPADLALQKAVKRALDPHNLFNPGRFVTDAFV